MRCIIALRLCLYNNYNDLEVGDDNPDDTEHSLGAMLSNLQDYNLGS